MKNLRIRERAAQDGVFLWEIADRLGLSDGNFSRKLRHELSTEEQERIFGLIDEIVAQRKEA